MKAIGIYRALRLVLAVVLGAMLSLSSFAVSADDYGGPATVVVADQATHDPPHVAVVTPAISGSDFTHDEPVQIFSNREAVMDARAWATVGRQPDSLSGTRWLSSTIFGIPDPVPI